MEYDYQSDIFERGDLRQVAEDEVEYAIQEKSIRIIEPGAIVSLTDNKGKTLTISCGKDKQGAQTIDLESGLYKAIEAKKEGDYIEFGKGFSITKVLYS